MVQLKIKGNEFSINFVNTSSYTRYARLFESNILASLKKIGISQNNIRLKEEIFPMKKAGAEVYWWINGFNCYYSYSRREKYIENLQIIAKVVDLEVSKVLSGIKTIEEFVIEFREDEDMVNKRKKAREFLGLEANENNLEVIDKKYKQMAKDLHPDMENGSTEKFKKLNEAHKTLKKELE